VSWAVAALAGWVGWAVAVAAALALRRRTALVADAEHELRGAATAIGVAASASPLVQLQVDRMTVALADLARARGAQPADPIALGAGRLAQVLANVSANAAEHGVGPVHVRGARTDGVVRLEVSNAETPGVETRRPAAGRGRGLRIAKRAARELGGRVSLVRVDGAVRAVIELPAARGEREDGAKPGGVGRRGAGRDDAPRDDAGRDDAARDDAGRDDAARNDARRDDAARDDAGRDDAARDDLGRGDRPRAA
jgi:hypothetical protein